MPPSGTTAGTAPHRPAALRLPGLRGDPAGLLRNVGRIRHLCRHPALPRVRRQTARRRCACAGLGGDPAGLLRNVGRIRYLCHHPALPRVRRLTARRRCACRAWGRYPVVLFRNVGRIRHLCRHPALPRVRRLTARRRCACAGLRGYPARLLRNVGRIRHLCRHPAGTATDRPAALRLRGPTRGSRRPPQERRPDKAFMPPSGTTTGMELEVSCPAALRLPGLGGIPHASSET
ncbi:hypothetical protein WP5S18E05_08860 [Klebsiella quasipneumoniae]|nr:hypothetical protein WP5S18E05_08860 [Klebsiella quasipneumoniae]